MQTAAAAATVPARTGVRGGGVWRRPAGSYSLGPYRLERVLGRGVYVGRDGAGARVAVKVLAARPADEATWRRFALECALLSAVDDRRVVRLRGHGVFDGLAYLALDYIEGGTLRARMRGALSPSAAACVLCEAAGGVAALHAAGIVHRDIKPDNLLVSADGALVLADLGAAARVGDAAACAQDGCLIGSLRYAAPEQLTGAVPAPSADVYSLGVLFHELLCGRTPFAGGTPLEILAQHLVAPIPRLPLRLQAWQPLIDRLLDKRPEHRPPDARAVLEAFWSLAPREHAGAGID